MKLLVGILRIWYSQNLTKRAIARLVYLVGYLFITLPIQSQTIGLVCDENNGEPISSATVTINHNKSIQTDSTGYFVIEDMSSKSIRISSVGYNTKTIKIKSNSKDTILIFLSPDIKRIDEVVIVGKKHQKYSRKNNSAVDLMRKVIAAKKSNNISQIPYLNYKSYQKLMAGFNDLKPKDLTEGIFDNRPWLKDYVEKSQYNDKQIMPFTMEEIVTIHSHQRTPHLNKSKVIAQNVHGINTLFQSGNILNTILNEYFTDINIYDDNIRLFQNSFCSPIGRDAILFYHYYITDTLLINNINCYQIEFTPSNQQNFGFCGKLFVTADSSYQVKRCEMTLPISSDVNWIKGMKCIQEYSEIKEDAVTCTSDDMIAEIKVTSFTAQLVVVRNTNNYDFTFQPLSEYEMQNTYSQSKIQENDSTFWRLNRKANLSPSELKMDTLVTKIKKLKGANFFIPLFRALAEGYVETSSDNNSKFDIGPIFSSISQNFYDGIRLRIGGQTTSYFLPHLFWSGYYSRALKSHKNYYNSNLTYTFNTPQYLPHEFPQKSISFESSYDVAFPSDKYNSDYKDNLFSSFKFDDMDKMFLYNRQSLKFIYEKEPGVKYKIELKREDIQPIGNISFTAVKSGQNLRHLRCTEATIGFIYSPNVTHLNTKIRRLSMNYNSPVIRVQHTIGIKGLLSGDLKYNYSEFELFKPTWLPLNFGRIDAQLIIGKQWDEVPYPLLVTPATNVGYFILPNTFDLINNMEFFNDQYMSLILGWDLNGKLFNNIPLLKKLKCREFIGARILWGKLSDRNNPMIQDNCSSQWLLEFPEGTYIMNPKHPYYEVAIGIHNIFNILHLEYIRRLNYLDLHTAKKDIIKISLEFKF